MKIIVESHVPFIRGVMEKQGAEVVYLEPDQITKAAVSDADALVVRTRTRCGQALLDGSRVRLVTTATIGTDHIDLEWCRAHGIRVVNAPGCNAPAVAQYVLSSAAHLVNRPLSQMCIGIVGVGHVGSIVERWSRALDMEVLRSDPPRERAEGGCWNSLAEMAQKADIVTVHTPLTHSGADRTEGLLGEEFFASCRRNPIMINAARGGIVDEHSLVEALARGRVSSAVTDCWAGEPRINGELLRMSAIATPHIAGYSRQGKIRATAAVLNAVSDFFVLEKMEPAAEAPQSCAWTVSVRSVADSYDPIADSMALKNDPASFESLRNGYALRAEAPGAPID